MDHPESRWQHMLAGHPVDQPAGHQHVDQRGVRHGEHGDEREDLVDGQPGCARLHHLDKRGVAGLQFTDGNKRHGHDRHQDVDDPGDRQTRQQNLRKRLDGVFGLLGHVDRVLEADHGEERQRRRCGDGHEGVLLVGGVERDDPREVDVTAAEGPHADHDHGDEAGDLDDGEHHVELDALTDTTKVDRRQRRHESQGKQRHPELRRLSHADAFEEIR